MLGKKIHSVPASRTLIFSLQEWRKFIGQPMACSMLAETKTYKVCIGQPICLVGANSTNTHTFSSVAFSLKLAPCLVDYMETDVH